MRVLAFALVLSLAGCAMTNPTISRNLTSGAIGCPPSEIKISEETANVYGNHNWKAECKGRSFICNYHHTSGVDCKEPI
jgi:hypothetical protein